MSVYLCAHTENGSREGAGAAKVTHDEGGELESPPGDLLY